MVITDSGNVGIGTTNPIAQLQAETNETKPAVYGNATAAGTGVYGRSVSGFAMYSDGNTGQARDKGGWVKAMVYVNGDGTILRCYNGITVSSSGNCGFSATRGATPSGEYYVNFGFQINNRFYSGIVEDFCCGTGVVANFFFLQPNSLGINVRDKNGFLTDRPFMLIVY